MFKKIWFFILILLASQAKASLFYIKAGTDIKPKTEFSKELHEKTDASRGNISIEGAVGMEYLPNKRLELNVIYNSNDSFELSRIRIEANNFAVGTIPLKTHTVSKYKNVSVFLNHYFDIGEFDFVKPYIMVGVGYAKNSINDVSIDEETQVPLPLPIVPLPTKQVVTNHTTYKSGQQKYLAWNIGLGIAVEATNSLSLEIGYRFSDYGRLKSSKIWTKTDNTQVPPVLTAGDDKNLMLNRFWVHSVTLSLRYAL